MILQQSADRVHEAAAPAREERRQNWRNDPGFQNRFRLAMLQLVLAALTPTMVISLVVSHSVKYPEIYLDSPWVLLATLATAFTAAARGTGTATSATCCAPTATIRISPGFRPSSQCPRRGHQRV